LAIAAHRIDQPWQSHVGAARPSLQKQLEAIEVEHAAALADGVLIELKALPLCAEP
jgi:hypothetical protein